MAETNGAHTGKDISRGRLGSTYAKAYLAVAEKTGRAEQLVDELAQVVHQLIERFPRLDATLASPRLASDEKIAMLDRILSGRVSDELLRFFKIVARHGRMDCLREIRDEARRLFQQSHGRVAVTVITAHPIGDELAESIRGRLGEKLGRQVELSRQVDPDLLGGLVVRVADTVFDGSVANQLKRLRQHAVQQAFEQLRENADQLAADVAL